MNYNVKVSCENQAKVFNFREDSFSEGVIVKVLKGVAKKNYTVEVSHGFKRNRGKAMSFYEVVSAIEELRFYKFVRVLEVKSEEHRKPILDMQLPDCYIISDLVYWGTFFEIGAFKTSLIKPDISKIKTLFNRHGLDLKLAKNGRYYTHNRVEFELISRDDWNWRLSKIVEIPHSYWKEDKVEL